MKLTKRYLLSRCERFGIKTFSADVRRVGNVSYFRCHNSNPSLTGIYLKTNYKISALLHEYHHARRFQKNKIIYDDTRAEFLAEGFTLRVLKRFNMNRSLTGELKFIEQNWYHFAVKIRAENDPHHRAFVELVKQGYLEKPNRREVK